MSNFATLIDAARPLTEEQIGAWLQTLGITPNMAANDEPDQYGAVACRAIKASRVEHHQRFIIKSIIDALPDGDPRKTYGQGCLNNVNTWYEMNGTVTWACQDAKGNNIPNMLAVASVNKRDGTDVYPTPQAFTDHINSLPDPGPASGPFGNY